MATKEQQDARLKTFDDWRQANADWLKANIDWRKAEIDWRQADADWHQIEEDVDYATYKRCLADDVDWLKARAEWHKARAWHNTNIAQQPDNLQASARQNIEVIEADLVSEADLTTPLAVIDQLLIRHQAVLQQILDLRNQYLASTKS